MAAAEELEFELQKGLCMEPVCVMVRAAATNGRWVTWVEEDIKPWGQDVSFRW